MDDTATFHGLAEEVLSSIKDTMKVGQTTKHIPGIWQTESTDHHVQHAITHLIDFVRYGRREDLEHALCRVGMAWWTYVHRK